MDLVAFYLLSGGESESGKLGFVRSADSTIPNTDVKQNNKY